MGPPPPPTIIDIKHAFLTTQIRLLSQPLSLSPSLITKVTSNETDDAEPLRERAIDDALHKLNQTLKRHNRLVYGPQATRHVAEQIDRLYWGAAGGVGEEGNGEVEGVERGSDLRNDAIIARLPSEWEEESSSKADSTRYTSLITHLQSLSARRSAARSRLERYKALQELLRPLDVQSVQENLVTRGGEVEAELEKMRMLMLRVERGLRGGGGEGDGGDGDGDGEGEERMDVDGDVDIDAETDARRRLEGILG